MNHISPIEPQDPYREAIESFALEGVEPKPVPAPITGPLETVIPIPPRWVRVRDFFDSQVGIIASTVFLMCSIVLAVVVVYAVLS